MGYLALGHGPSALRFDHCWPEGGVHQVWGLGIHLWRLPFEAAARVLGAQAFPDIPAFGIALGLATFFFLKALWTPDMAVGTSVLPSVVRPSGIQDGPAAWFWKVGGGLLMLVFPPFCGCCEPDLRCMSKRIAYEYVFGIGLLAGLIALVRAPRPGRYALVCLLAGLGGLVRPTLILHGIAVVIAGAWWLWRVAPSNAPGSTCDWAGIGPMRLRPWVGAVVPGVARFVAGGTILFWTNLLRFGDGFELGHKLNVQTLYGSLYATRFDHPFADEPLRSAARELFGLLLLPKQYTPDFYASNLFPRQSSTLRWREVGLPTHDLTYLMGLTLAGCAALVMTLALSMGNMQQGRILRFSSTDHWWQLAAVLGWYSLLASLFLGTFYLRNDTIHAGTSCRRSPEDF